MDVQHKNISLWNILRYYGCLISAVTIVFVGEILNIDMQKARAIPLKKEGGHFEVKTNHLGSKFCWTLQECLPEPSNFSIKGLKSKLHLLNMINDMINGMINLIRQYAF